MAYGRSALLRVRHDQIPSGQRLGTTSATAGRRPSPRVLARRLRHGLHTGVRRRAGVMKFALVNPAWTFEGSIYFGCREPHLPLEFGYAKALLERDAHD